MPAFKNSDEMEITSKPYLVQFIDLLSARVLNIMLWNILILLKLWSNIYLYSALSYLNKEIMIALYKQTKHLNAP